MYLKLYVSYTNHYLSYMRLESHILKDELGKLEKMTGIKTKCSLVWNPKVESIKEGEVLGKTIYIYSCNLDDAINTLRHEFFDALICKTNKPYVQIINTLLSIMSEKIYSEKEEIVEILVQLTRCCDSISANNDLTVA